MVPRGVDTNVIWLIEDPVLIITRQFINCTPGVTLDGIQQRLEVAEQGKCYLSINCNIII